MKDQPIVTRSVRMGAGALLVGAVALSGCSGNSLGLSAGGQSQLAFSATASATASGAAFASGPITSGTHTLDLTQVSLTVERAELKRAHTDGCLGDDDDDDKPATTTATTPSTANCAEVKIGPTTVDLPLTGSLVNLPANVIPAGTYREFKLRVSQVRLVGTFDGKAFDVMLPVKMKQEIEFETPLVVTEGTATSITVNVPVDGWLKNADGSLVDPSKILSTPALFAAVKVRIAASLRAFEDRDHDGKDDHGHHGG